MKRDVPSNPKLLELAATLEVPEYAAIGILCYAWNITAAHHPRGDVGRWSNRRIAASIKWSTADADRLVDALIATGWLDEHDDPGVRLVVHDWSEHAERTVHNRLGRAGEHFADGKAPNLAGLPSAERAKAAQAFKNTDSEHTPNTRIRTARTRIPHACAEPAPEPEPAPAPEPQAQGAGGRPAQVSAPGARTGAEPARPASAARGEPDPEPGANGRPMTTGASVPPGPVDPRGPGGEAAPVLEAAERWKGASLTANDERVVLAWLDTVGPIGTTPAPAVALAAVEDALAGGAEWRSALSASKYLGAVVDRCARERRLPGDFRKRDPGDGGASAVASQLEQTDAFIRRMEASDAARAGGAA